MNFVNLKSVICRISHGPLGEAIQYGEDLVMETQTFAKSYVGNGLNCRSCHLGGGNTAFRRAKKKAGLKHVRV